MLLLGSAEDALLREARETTRRVARTFGLACRLLPGDVRDDVYRLYLVFRTLDDLVDEGRPDAEARVAAVETWCRRPSGRFVPATLETRLLADLATRHALPRRALLDFCAGMRHDLEGAAIATEADLDGYCYRVAGTVGLTMAALLGTRDDERALPAAAALGMAMQRTNVLRDIDEDRAVGRVYVPREAVDRHGSLDAGARDALLRDQIARADALYERGLAGVPLLLRGRRAVAAAAGMYREILRQIERDGYGAAPGRAVVPLPRKVLAAVRAAA